MPSRLKLDENRLLIFHEGRKRRIFVAELNFNAKKNRYVLSYDKKYVYLKNAIPLGPELSLFKLKHISKEGRLFPSFIDRIPDKLNPAYEDYCRSQGISPDEKNKIILLGTIGKRGPSTFIFEPVYYSEFKIAEIKKWREKLDITQHDLANAFDLSQNSLQRLESGISTDPNILKLLQILFEFPDVALWQLKQTGNRIHKNSLKKLRQYFEELKSESSFGLTTNR